MIDLTKPIRRKGGPVVRVEDGFYVVHPPSAYVDFSHASYETKETLERDYENIPETRKPREWLIHEHAHNGVMLAVNAHGPPKGSCCIRVVEWPQDAPLPDWPEGYE